MSDFGDAVDEIVGAMTDVEDAMTNTDDALPDFGDAHSNNGRCYDFLGRVIDDFEDATTNSARACSSRADVSMIIGRAMTEIGDAYAIVAMRGPIWIVSSSFCGMHSRILAVQSGLSA
jgi:hypothetical protein